MALSAWQATIVNESGDVIPSASIEVIDKGTGLAATIYSTVGGASLGNPFPANSGGFGRFYAEAGTYNITASDSGSGFSETWNDVRLGDAQEKDIGTLADQVPTNANLSAAVCGAASFSSDVYTFTPVGTGFRPLQAGMYLSFKLPNGSANTTATPDIDYSGSTYVIKWIDGSALAAGDLDDDYNKQPILFYFDGTDLLIASDISGSNANGEWCKKVDGGLLQRLSGTLDQSASTTNAFGTTSGTTYYARDTFTFPKIFSDTNYTGDVSSTSTTISDGTYDSKTTSGARLSLSSVANGSTDNPFDAFFMGRWY